MVKIQMEKHSINPKESQAYKIVPLMFVSEVTEELVTFSILSLIAIPSIFFKIDRMCEVPRVQK